MNKMNRLRNQTVENFFSDLSSPSPTPGGGSAAAVCGAMAASLVVMVANLTIGKKGYLDADSQMQQIIKRTINYRNTLLNLADKDTEAFLKVIAAFKLGKENTKRSWEIQRALKEAAKVPLKTAILSKEIERLAGIVAKNGNKHALSDAKCALYLAKAARLSALENVKVNLVLISDKNFIRKIKDEIKKNFC